MEQKITETIKLKHSYKVDEQFLVCLNKIFITYDPKVIMRVEVVCEKSMKYSFNTIDEFVEYSSGLTDVIMEMEIRASFSISETTYCTNDIYLSFSNDADLFSLTPGEIRFDFNNRKDYLALKNELEILLKNYQLSYSVLSRVPIVALIDAGILGGIIGYTKKNNIVFSQDIQDAIWLAFSCILVTSIFVGFFRKMKRFIFPFVEFEFGSNINKNNKARNIRNILLSGVVLAMLVGIATNYVSNFLF